MRSVHSVSRGVTGSSLETKGHLHVHTQQPEDRMGAEGEISAGGKMGIIGKGQGHPHSHPTYPLGNKQGGQCPQPWHLGGKSFA